MGSNTYAVPVIPNMVQNKEETGGSGERASEKLENKGKSSGKVTLNVERDSEEYRKLRERNNEAVKKSRTRTKLRTQGTLEKVEKLRGENGKLEERIDGLKKELDLLKELFVSHAGTKSMKRLTEVDMETLLNEAAPSGKKKKGAVPYTGRNREQIEKEMQALLGLADEDDDEVVEDDDDEDDDDVADDADDDLADMEEESPQPSTSQLDQSELTMTSDMIDNSVMMNDSIQTQTIDETVVAIEDLAGNQNHLSIGQTYTIIQDASGPTIWTSEDGESVVVTTADDGQSTLVASDVQHHLHDIIQGEILMLQ